MMSDTEPVLAPDPMSKRFMAGINYGPKKSRWSIDRQFFRLNPAYPDSIEFLDQRKVPTKSTLLDHGLTSLKIFLSYQDLLRRMWRLID